MKGPLSVLFVVDSCYLALKLTNSPPRTSDAPNESIITVASGLPAFGKAELVAVDVGLGVAVGFTVGATVGVADGVVLGMVVGTGVLVGATVGTGVGVLPEGVETKAGSAACTSTTKLRVIV
jgi:hypothetical protein